MVRVAVFMSSGAYSPNGVSKYVGRLFSMKQWFIENGIELLGPYCGSTSFSDASIYTQSFAYKVKQTIKESLSLCKAGSMLAINKAYISHAREAVSRYRESGAPSFDIGLFNDPFTILAYNETTKDSFSDICYVTHDDGHFCKMLLDAFPKLPKVYVDDLRAKVFPICSRFIMVGGKNKEIFDLSYPEYSDRSVHIHTGIEPLCKNEAVDLNPDDHGISRSYF